MVFLLLLTLTNLLLLFCEIIIKKEQYLLEYSMMYNTCQKVANRLYLKVFNNINCVITLFAKKVQFTTCKVIFALRNKR